MVCVIFLICTLAETDECLFLYIIAKKRIAIIYLTTGHCPGLSRGILALLSPPRNHADETKESFDLEAGLMPTLSMGVLDNNVG